MCQVSFPHVIPISPFSPFPIDYEIEALRQRVAALEREQEKAQLRRRIEALERNKQRPCFSWPAVVPPAHLKPTPRLEDIIKALEQKQR